MSTGGDQLDPDRLEAADFPLVRKGFEPDLVRTQFVVAADEIRRLRALVTELEREITELESQPTPELEAQRITEAIGEEAVRVLDAARVAASERAERAEAEAADVIAEAERAADGVRSGAEVDRDRILAEARAAADELVERGREQGREMVAEAQTVRERMLRDLARKRQSHRAELEQLRAGRDRLLESLVDAQNHLDASTSDLVAAVPEAQAAAERAGLRINSEPELTVDQLESEIASARLVGHPLVDGVPLPETDGELERPETGGEYDAEIVEPEEIEEIEYEASSGPDLYDVETELAEDEADGLRADDGDSEDAGAEAVDGDEDSTGVDDVFAPAEAVDGDEDSADVDDLFARLRSSREDAVAEAEAVLATEPESVADGEEDAVAADAPLDEPESVADGEEDAVAEASPGEPEPDPDAGAVSDAVAEIARSLKRIVVDEQGDLLDGIRRDGADALRTAMVDDDAYDGALVEPLKNLVTAVAGDDTEVAMDEARSSVRHLLVEPVRTRLEEALRETEDPDELSGTVRAVYRECRSRRVGEAATAAVSATYEIALGVRESATA